MKLFACSVVLALGLSAPAYAQDGREDGRRISGSLRTGAEYDDNVFRLEGDGQVGGFLSRYFANLDLATRATGRSVVSATLSHGGKFFFADEQGDADTLLSQGSVAYRLRLWDPLGIWAQADLRDRTERVLKRDYTTGGVGSGIEATAGPASLRMGTAARFFAFKPNPEASSNNVEGVSSLSVKLPEGVSVYLGYNVARRAFDTDRFDLDDDDDPVAVEGEPRRDIFHVSSLGAAYRGRIVADLNYGYSVNTSNSFGQGLRRHSLDLTLTAPMPWRLFASLHAELQRTSYDDPVRVDAEFRVDEDNRNAVVVSVVRALGDHWEIEVRYSLYLQEFGVGSDYRRQTGFLAVAYVFGE